MIRNWLFMLSLLSGSVSAEEYGAGLLCPRPDSQISFYTENNQQDAAGTLGFAAGTGFAVTSDNLKDVKAAGAHTVESLCDGGMPGIRIDAKRDGWLQAGVMWIPPNQEWDYGDWQEYLHKAAVWKPLGPIELVQGTSEAPYKDRPYADMLPERGIEIYPVKFVDDFALVVLDRAGAYTKTCAGTFTAPEGKMGWLHLVGENGKSAAVPAHLKGC